MKLASLYIIGLCLCALFSPAALAQREYSSETGSWKFTCPEGWSPIGFDIIKREEEQMRAEWPEKNFKYIAGFTKGGMNTFAFPHILINKTEVDLSGAKFEDIEFGLQVKEPKYERELVLGNLVNQFIMGPTTLDRTLVRTVGLDEEDMFGDSGEPLRCWSYSYLGKSFIIRFECYDLKSNGDKNKAAFENFVKTFSFRQDSKFVPVPEGEKSKYDASNYSTTPINAKPERSSSSSGSYRIRRFGIGGLIIAGVVGLVLKLLIRD